jgi:hypothetical protein
VRRPHPHVAASPGEDDSLRRLTRPYVCPGAVTHRRRRAALSIGTSLMLASRPRMSSHNVMHVTLKDGLRRSGSRHMNHAFMPKFAQKCRQRA